MNDQELRKTTAHHMEKVAAPLVDTVWPIYEVGKRKEPHLVGSCVLLRIASHHFLLSAGHVIRAIRKTDLYLGAGDKIPLLGGKYFTTGPADLDLGVFFPDDDVVASVPDSGFITSELLYAVPPEPSREIHLVIGYPRTKQPTRVTKREFDAVPISVTAYSLTASEHLEAGYDPLESVLLEFNKKKVWSAGGRVTASDPIGMSGGGVWNVPELLESPTPRAALAAIQIEWHKVKPQRLLATRIQPCLALIVREVPELDSHLSLFLQ